MAYLLGLPTGLDGVGFLVFEVDPSEIARGTAEVNFVIRVSWKSGG